MAKRINTLQKFFIDNNANLTSSDLAKATGLTTKQVENYKKRQDGLNRSGKQKSEPDTGVTTSPERADELTKQSQKAALGQADKLLPVQGRPAPAMRIDALIARHGNTTSLTGPASELADLFDGIGPDNKGAVLPKFDPFSDTSKVHKIK
jgi:hypothetical protein